MTPLERASVAVLLVEDDASMAKLVRHLLEMDGYRQIRHVYTGEQAMGAAREAEIILLDHQLPDIRGIDLLPRLLNRADPPAVIMVTGHGNESLAAAALRLGEAGGGSGVFPPGVSVRWGAECLRLSGGSGVGF